jgi:uncharacterized protein with PIN domain
MELEPLQDKVLICADCNEEFVFTVSAQQYFLEKGFTEEPKRCKYCYTRLKKEKRQQQKEAKRRAHYERSTVHASNSRNGEGRDRANMK